MVAGEQARPSAIVHGFLLRLELFAQMTHVELDDIPLRVALIDANVIEEEQHIEFLVRRVGDVFVAHGVHTRRFADVHVATALFEDFATHLLEEFVDTRTVRAERIRRRVSFLACRIIVDCAVRFARQMSFAIDDLRDLRDDVHAEAVDAAIHPPVHHVVHGFAHGRILPVEVRLLLRILVQEVLAALLVVLPCGAAEVRTPLIGFGSRFAGRLAFARRTPPVPVRLIRVRVA